MVSDIDRLEDSFAVSEYAPEIRNGGPVSRNDRPVLLAGDCCIMTNSGALCRMRVEQSRTKRFTSSVQYFLLNIINKLWVYNAISVFSQYIHCVSKNGPTLKR